MPPVTYTLRMRERRNALHRRNFSGKIALIAGVLIGLSVALMGILVALAYTSLTRDLPSVEILPALFEPPSGLLLRPTQLYDRSGTHVILTLQNPAAAERQYLRVAAQTGPAPLATDGESFPTPLISATLAASDARFWSHPGCSPASLRKGGVPTLAQRLASTYLLSDEPAGLRRSGRECLLAMQITSRFGREKVLEWTLNSADYGRLAHGADAAARTYFGKPGTELNLAEAALLAGVAEAPALNPFDAPQAALERQKGVLQELLRYRMVKPEEGIQAVRQELTFHQPERPGTAFSALDLEPRFAPAFAQLALEQLQTQMPRSQIERGGLRVITTLDYDLQYQANCAALEQLARLQSAAVESPTAGGENCEAARLLPTLPSNIDPPLAGVEVEAVMSDPATGQILALVGRGAASPEDIQLPHHPVGSLATSYIYLTAFTRGWSPASLIWDIPIPGEQNNLQNFDGAYHGPMRLRIAQANDYLVPAGRILTQVGAETVWRTAQQMGIPFPEPESEGLDSPVSLIRDANLLEISQAFNIFANQGILAGRPLKTENGTSEPGLSLKPTPLLPSTVLRVEEGNGNILLDWSKSQQRPIISSQLAYLMTHVLSDETARWPSLGHPNPLEIGQPAAARVGRTTNGENAWIVGYTPQRVAGIWMGWPQSQGELPEPAIQALQNASAGLWHAMIQYASRAMPYQDWPEPSGLSRVQVCDPSGLLPTEECPNVVDEIFLAGSEPVQEDPLYRALPVNEQTGRLATVFTALDLVQPRIFLMPPAEAEDWAKGSGLAIPPDDYDAIPASLRAWPNVEITSPAMFEAVSGELPVWGRAAGDKFGFYRLLVGQGLNPQAWLQIGEDSRQPVEDGRLGIWDTRGLNGLYALQLLVIRQDRGVEKVTKLVTVDNQPPEVKILYPGEGTEVTPIEGGKIVLQIQADDNLAIESVKIFVDGSLLTTLIQPPFALSWKAGIGQHSLRVQATDRAGNTRQAIVMFTVK